MSSKKHLMTSCGKTGIKIKNTGNDYTQDPFANVDPFKNRPIEKDNISVDYNSCFYDSLDLNLDNYSRDDLYKLFGFKPSIMLTEDNMKHAKTITLKTHPDKSRLDNKYFVFFGAAYKKLLHIYEFQNKSTKKTTDKQYFDAENVEVLDKMFEMKTELKQSGNFNNWFNEQFEKNRLEGPIEHGYDKWLKSDEDIIFTPQKITKDTMGKEIEKHKKQIQALTPYTGIGETVISSSVGGSSLMEYNSNFSSGSLFSNGSIDYTDLRQAYAESVIPVTEEDFIKIQQFKNVDDYKKHRNTIDLNPQSKEEAMRQLYQQEKNKNEESAALAFYYAQQSEKAKKNNDTFWSSLKQLTNW